MRGRIKNLMITVGLPGSGKTTWSRKYAKKNRDFRHYESDGYYHRERGIEDYVKHNGAFSKYTVLDGLFLRKDDIDKILTIIEGNMVMVDEVNIVCWNVDREACIWNDLYRREDDSAITISNAIVDSFRDISNLEKKFPKIKFNVMEKEVIRKEPYEVFATKHNFRIDAYGMHKGDSWCTGGSWADCWGNTGGVSGSEQPDGMYELDEFLEKVAPNITFLQYKNITNTCVSTEDFTDGDYYGGTTYHLRYMLDVRKLYDYLVEKEIINEIE